MSPFINCEKSYCEELPVLLCDLHWEEQRGNNAPMGCGEKYIAFEEGKIGIWKAVLKRM